MKKAKVFLVGAAMFICVGGVFALRAHRGVVGDLQTCASGVCSTVIDVSDNADQGGTEQPNSTVYYKGTVGVTCGCPSCPSTVPPNVWIHN